MSDSTSRPPLVGNRLVLVGSVTYLLEWVAIIAGGVAVPVGPDGSSAEVMAAYAGHQQAVGWAAGWLSVVLLGRILIATGLRSALTDSGRPQRLMDLAVAAMAVGVTLEIAAYGLTAGGALMASREGSPDGLRTIDAAAWFMNLMLDGPLGVALLCCGVAMWRSGLFPRALAVLGAVAGAVFVIDALAFVAPRFAGSQNALSSAALLFWIWMLWCGVLLWRRTPTRRDASAGRS